MDIRDRMDPQVRARLDQYLAVVGPQGLSGIEDIPERRRRQAELTAGHRPAGHPGAAGEAGDVEVRDHGIRGGTDTGPPVRVRVYRPRGAPPVAPCVLYLHGGGLVAGSVDGDDARAAGLARATDCVVVSVDYRLAPENPYPAAVDDCFAALVWVAESHRRLRVDPRRLALYGPSAGGCLAAATALLARDRGGPGIACLMLVSPMLDDRPTPSHRTNTGFGAWSREANVQAWQAFLGADFGTDRVSPYAAPARAGDLTGLPPAYVDIGDLDLFRDEAVDFALRLMRAGVPVELHVHPGGIHGGENLAPEAGSSVRLRGHRHSALRRTLGVGT
ncbi:alpha/beta hydrolase [Streptomyces fructofermentans]|uniref:Alpha/beta hydrolase n=1 Tax=Streptomyces fructofermentans TaxID=152141 RepID=A0A918NFR8_9ACTN|nr:alpha/beta hydrolase [Streptomyces fructofermentans]GGX63765.1 alpha/beta hydrolase [Streptomyces fructofermentans]